MTLRETLAQAGLRPTRQRLRLAQQLFDGRDKHVTAEALHREIITSAEQSVSHRYPYVSKTSIESTVRLTVA